MGAAAKVQVLWESTDVGLRPRMADGTPVAWAYQSGFQEDLLSLPPPSAGGPFEVLLGGNRGGGKSTANLVDFAQHVGKGWGRAWRGILFRQEHDQLGSIINESLDIFGRAFPDAKFNESKCQWTWATGEQLLFRQMKTDRDYAKRHGQQFARVIWDDLTLWPYPGPYLRMLTTIRSPVPGMPVGSRGSTNPHGPGHSWVKRRFNLPLGYAKPAKLARGDYSDMIYALKKDGKRGLSRMSIRAMLVENLALLEGTPDYLDQIVEGAESEAQRKAWENDDWNIVAGGMFDDVWRPEYHVVPSIPFDQIPRGWRLDRAYDDGSSKPFSMGVWAESNGESVEVYGQKIGGVRGDLIRVAEWYGWDGKTPNVGLRMSSREVAKGIREKLGDWGIWSRTAPGPADDAIYNGSLHDPSKTVASEMEKEGVSWVKAGKGPGSRVAGWKLLFGMLKGAIPDAMGRRETPGIFACERCEHYIRTLPLAPRSKLDYEDIDSTFEDHVLDETRYRIRAPSSNATVIPGGRITIMRPR